MKKLLIVAITLLLSNICEAQDIQPIKKDIGPISNDDIVQNKTGQTVYYMPLSKVQKCLDLETKFTFDSIRVEKYKELTSELQQRISLADSATQLRSLEAEFWKLKLDSNDEKLEAERETSIRLRADVEKAKRSRMYFFIAGVLSTSVAVIAFK